MGPIIASPRELAASLAVFVGLILLLALLSQAAGWPHAESGWPLAFVVAAVFSVAPFMNRILNFLQQNRASVRLPGGVTIDLGPAMVAAPVAMPDNLAAPGIELTDSGAQELDKVARMAASQPVVTIDLRDGRAWYRTRLFALACMGAVLGSPRVIVILGQKAEQKQRPGGWIRPTNIVQGFTRVGSIHPNYAEAWEKGQRYLSALRSQQTPLPPDLVDCSFHQNDYARLGDAVILHIIVKLLEPPKIGGPAMEPWVSLAEMEAELDPWLVRDTVELTSPARALEGQILTSNAELMLATRGGAYAGYVDCVRVLREILRAKAT